MSIDLTFAREEFEKFLSEMDVRIETLQDKATSLGFVLDMSLESLVGLETVFEAEIGTTDVQADMIVTCGRYLGEVARLAYGGHWHLPLEDASNVYYNQPVIVGHRDDDVEFAPISVMRAFAKKRERGMLRRAIDAQVSPARLDLSDLLNKDQKA